MQPDSTTRRPVDPGSPALRRIAALAGLRRWVEVEREARRLLIAEPDTWPGHTWLSRALREQGRAEEALAAAERAVACAPEEGPPYELLGRALFLLGRGAEGLRAARDAVSRAPTDLTALQFLADAACQRDLDTAREAAATLCRIAPGWPLTHVTSGGVHLAEGRYGAAERSARAALRLAPHSIEGLVLLGTSFASRGRLVEALDVYQRALSESPDDYVARYYVAQALMLLPPSSVDARAGERAAQAQRILASVPARLHPRLLLEAAWDLLDQGRGREARAALAEAEGLLDTADPRHATRRTLLIRLRARMLGFGGDVDGAVRIMLDGLPEAERALGPGAELEAFRTSLGLHHLLAGEASEALRLLQSTLEGARSSRRLGPLIQTLRHTASAHEDLRDPAMARRLRREAVRIAAREGRDDRRCLVAELDLAEDEAEERDPQRVLRTADRLGERLRELGHARVATRCDELAAGALIRLGDHAGARERLLDAVVVRRHCGERTTAPTLARLALVAGRTGRPAVAARLLRLAERRARRARHRQLVIDVATELRTGGDPGAVARP